MRSGCLSFTVCWRPSPALMRLPPWWSACTRRCRPSLRAPRSLRIDFQQTSRRAIGGIFLLFSSEGWLLGKVAWLTGAKQKGPEGPFGESVGDGLQLDSVAAATAHLLKLFQRQLNDFFFGLNDVNDLFHFSIPSPCARLNDYSNCPQVRYLFGRMNRIGEMYLFLRWAQDQNVGKWAPTD